ncbi:hypothetical protein ACFOEK_20785 [Litoribrevibacter euphylliae]|uniref:Uncharacterized protein n=1 Tax=Litoribrevibacter euphylliae TaxID=1834034 RepID=A0ABV7HLK0_9GAMM
MSHYLTYATKEESYDYIKEVVAEALGVDFEDHESGWWGEYAQDPKCAIRIYPNFVEGEGYHEKAEKDYVYLLELPNLNEVEPMKRIVSQMPIDFKLVRASEI